MKYVGPQPPMTVIHGGVKYAGPQPPMPDIHGRYSVMSWCPGQDPPSPCDPCPPPPAGPRIVPATATQSGISIGFLGIGPPGLGGIQIFGVYTENVYYNYGPTPIVTQPGGPMPTSFFLNPGFYLQVTTDIGWATVGGGSGSTSLPTINVPLQPDGTTLQTDITTAQNAALAAAHQAVGVQ